MSLRIAEVTATFPPYRAGTGTVVYHNARILHERGHSVEVFTAEFSGRAKMDYPYPVHFLHSFLRIGNAPLTPSLVAKLRGFDVIHLHYPYIFGAELVIFASRLWNIPIIMTYHNRLIQSDGGMKSLLLDGYNRLCEPLSTRRASRLIAVSEDHLQSLALGSEFASKSVEVPNGVDVELFSPGNQFEARDILGLDLNAFVVLFVGALDSAHMFKNVPLLIRAFELLNPASLLVIAGGGDMLEDFKRLANLSSASDRIVFSGILSPSELAPLYRAADVTVLPSVEVESFGLVLIESFACGTPVIATRLPGVRTVVDERVDGLLVEPGSLEELTSALAILFHDRVRVSEMGRRGRAKVVRDYAWDAVGKKLEDVITQLV